MEGEEIWKTLETAETSLMDMINVKDYNCSLLFDEENINKGGTKQPETVTLKLRADRQETEDFYLNKFREYMLGNNLMVRLQAKYDTMRRALALGEQDSGKDSTCSLSTTTTVSTSESSIINQSGAGGNRPYHRNSFLSQKPKRKRIGRTPMVGQPKLFGGSLEEYLEATNQEIPLVMKSTIRVINLYGLHHQGIFRVSGAQVEINHFKEAFERNEDPLADMSDASDINSVAGLLKLYLRELREPMFPIYYFDQLLQISRLESKTEFVAKLKDLVVSFPRAVFIIMRYLFAFLNHLSEYSDENMMDPYNLAICFGPTLLPIPEDKDQVQYQNLVNELVKNIIMYQEDIFPQDGGVYYEKYISLETPDENDVEDLPAEQISEEGLENNLVSVEDGLKERDIHLHIFGKSETLEALAQFDFTARSEREISFKKGDTLRLHTQVSNDWWKGSFDNHTGLIPDKYILIKIKDEDKDKGSSDENMRRTSSSSDSLSPGVKSPGCLPSKSSNSTSKLEESMAEHAVSCINHPILSQSKSSPLIGQQQQSPTVNPKFDSLLSTANDNAKAAVRSCSSSEITVHLARPATNNRPKEIMTVTVVHGKRHKGAGQIVDLSDDADDVGSTAIDDDDDEILKGIQSKKSNSAHVSAYSDSIELIGEKLNQKQQNLKKALIKDTPDLVMDLPTIGNSSASSPTSSATRIKQDGDSEVMSTAERFAISNQGTVKKNSRTTHLEGGGGGGTVKDFEISKSTSCMSVSAPASPCKPNFENPLQTYSTLNVSTFKPRLAEPAVKIKPPVMKKPINSNTLGSGSSSSEKLHPILDCKELKQTSC